jgi:hypothetical protein
MLFQPLSVNGHHRDTIERNCCFWNTDSFNLCSCTGLRISGSWDDKRLSETSGEIEMIDGSLLNQAVKYLSSVVFHCNLCRVFQMNAIWVIIDITLFDARHKIDVGTASERCDRCEH